jgi:ribosomal protein S10
MAGLLRALTCSRNLARPTAYNIFSYTKQVAFVSAHAVFKETHRPFIATAVHRAEQGAAEAKEKVEDQAAADFVAYEEQPDQAATFQRYGEGAIYPPKNKGKDWVAQLHLKSFDPRQIDYACGYVRHLAALLGVRTGSAIPLPKRTLLLSLIRGPHVHKTSQEQVNMSSMSCLLVSIHLLSS